MNSLLDLLVVAGYLVVVVTLGLVVSLKSRSRAAQKNGNAEGYFLAGHSLSWPIIGMALFATNISCVHLVSLAQAGFDSGLLIGNFEWMAALTLILLALFFAPIYLRSGVTTLPDYLEKRYDRSCRDWLTILSIASAVIVHIGFAFLTGGRMITYFIPELGNIYVAIIFIAALTGVYTIVGGLIAVVVTETLQTVVLLIGSTIITVVALYQLGGFGAVMEKLSELNEMERLSMLRPAGDPSGMSWYAVLLGYPVLGIWYWCADQTIVQRVLGARDANHARTGALFCAVLKIFPVFIFVLPGLVAYLLFKSGGLDISALQTVHDGKMVTDSKDILAVMIEQLLPTGLRGLVMAALLAALMSTVAGALNSISTLVSYDLYARFAPGRSDRQLIAVGRMVAGLALLVSIGLVPLLDMYDSLFVGLNDIIAHLAPSITCVFLIGVLLPAATAASARWTLWLGSALGVGVFVFNKLVPDNPLAAIPFMLMAFLLLVVCVVLQLVLTYLTRQPGATCDGRFAWSRPSLAFRESGWPGLADYRILCVLLVVLYCSLYWYFA